MSLMDYAMKTFKFEYVDKRLTINDMPTEIILEIAKLVGKSDVKSLISLKCFNWELYNVAIDRKICEILAIGTHWPMYIVWERMDIPEKNYLFRCELASNSELLWRLGMIEFFSKGNFLEGLDYMRRGATKYHNEACYVLAMLLILRGGVDAEEGILILWMLEEKLDRREYKNMFQRIIGCLREIWQIIYLVPWSMEVKCQVVTHTKERIIELGNGYDENIDDCGRCKCYHEFVKFCLVRRPHLV